MKKERNYSVISHDSPFNGSVDDPRILTDIEGGNANNVKRISENHFSIQMRPDVPSVYQYPDHHCYWFYFKIQNVRGKEVKIDITNCDWMPSHWKNYKPVFSYADDPDSLTGVEWNRIENTSLKRKRFSFTQKFEKNHAYVALRYPYNYTREKRYVEDIRDNKHADIEELGITAMGNPLYMVLLTDKRVPGNKKKGVLVYAREHGVEQDGSWVIEGMIDYLLSSEPFANTLRQNMIFMIMPIISPDSVVTGRVVDPNTGNSTGRELGKDKMNLIEARLLYDRLKRYVQNGNTLDICISLHNPHGTEPNLYPHYRPYKNSFILKNAKKLYKAVRKNAKGYTQWREFNRKASSYSVGRFARDFGSIAFILEVNHQAKKNYLSLEKLKGIGEVLLKGIADYYKLL